VKNVSELRYFGKTITASVTENLSLLFIVIHNSMHTMKMVGIYSSFTCFGQSWPSSEGIFLSTGIGNCYHIVAMYM
jgi:hypothetical protein